MLLLKIARLLHIISKEKYKRKRDILLVQNSPLFNAKWYSKQNPKCKYKKKSLAKHYLNYGWKEGLNPSKFFDGNAYLKNNPDVKNANICPLLHYVKKGKNEGRSFIGLNGKVFKDKSLTGRIKRALTKPIRVREEYYRIKREIKLLKNK